MMQISKSFLNQWQFPNCVGAIDGKHISIQCSPKSGSQFYSSYKKRFSIILMAACDAKYRFTWMNVGDYGGYLYNNYQDNIACIFILTYVIFLPLLQDLKVMEVCGQILLSVRL